MKKILSAFKPFASEIAHDFMLLACLLGPIFMGVIFRFALPMLEKFLCTQFKVSEILSPYYVVFDLLVAIMTPILFCFAGVLVILEELDCGVAKYYGVTPVGKGGYLLSRIGIPSILALLYDVLLLSVFRLSDIGFLMIILLSISGTLLAVVIALFVVSFAKNKIEGMALVKLSGVLIIGIPVAYFIASPVRYLFGILPSFWMAELCITSNYLNFVLAALISCLLIWVLHIRFKKKLL